MLAPQDKWSIASDLRWGMISAWLNLLEAPVLNKQRHKTFRMRLECENSWPMSRQVGTWMALNALMTEFV